MNFHKCLQQRVFTVTVFLSIFQQIIPADPWHGRCGNSGSIAFHFSAQTTRRAQHISGQLIITPSIHSRAISTSPVLFGSLGLINY